MQYRGRFCPFLSQTFGLLGIGGHFTSNMTPERNYGSQGASTFKFSIKTDVALSHNWNFQIKGCLPPILPLRETTVPRATRNLKFSIGVDRVTIVYYLYYMYYVIFVLILHFRKCTTCTGTTSNPGQTNTGHNKPWTDKHLT